MMMSCKRCGETKLKSEFRADIRALGGVASACDACERGLTALMSVPRRDRKIVAETVGERVYRVARPCRDQGLMSDADIVAKHGFEASASVRHRLAATELADISTPIDARIIRRY